MIKAFGIIGWSGSGKTTLLTALLPVFGAQGLSVSTIKHAHHDVALDRPDKDSTRHLAAGAAEVVLTTASGFALVSARPASLPALLARLAPVDLVLVEGFRGDDLPKLEVYRAALGKPPLWPELEVAGVASDGELAPCGRPVFRLDAVTEIANFILATLGIHHSRTC